MAATPAVSVSFLEATGYDPESLEDVILAAKRRGEKRTSEFLHHLASRYLEAAGFPAEARLPYSRKIRPGE